MSKKKAAKKARPKPIRILLRLFLAGIALVVAAGIYAMSVNGYILSYSDEYILTTDEAAALDDVDCILVLGAGIWGESLSPMLEDRMLTGISLFEKKASDRMLVSGDHGTAEYDEVNKMKSYAIEKGVPRDSIFMDHAGFSTYESMYRAKEIFGADKIIIVTQGYHLSRAVYDARKMGIEAYGVASDLRDYMHHMYNNTRELLARNKDFLWCIWKPEPTYLGDPIPISGSGSLTDDKIS